MSVLTERTGLLNDITNCEIALVVAVHYVNITGVIRGPLCSGRNSTYDTAICTRLCCGVIPKSHNTAVAAVSYGCVHTNGTYDTACKSVITGEGKAYVGSTAVYYRTICHTAYRSESAGTIRIVKARIGIFSA